MDFSDLMNIASSNQVNAVNKIKNKKGKNGSSSQVSSAAVKSFLARQNAEKAKQKEQEEAARRARIQARLHGKQLDKSKNDKKTEGSANVSVDKKNSSKNQNVFPAQNSTNSTSKGKLKPDLTRRKRIDDETAIVKSKEKEKLVKTSEQRTVEKKKPNANVKKPVQPVLSFQELMKVAKEQADNPDAPRSATAVPGAKISKNVKEKSPLAGPSTEDWREIEITRGKNTTSVRTNRDKSTNSQSKQSLKEKKLPDTAKRKKQECHDKKKTEIPNQKFQNNRTGKNDQKCLELKPRSSEKRQTMTIERQTVSQREYGSPMKYREPKVPFQRKRPRNMYDYDEDDYDDEMDEFIDDSEEAPQTVSSYIKEIFGYDKNKFRDRDEDIRNMESSFKDIQKEEAKSLRIAKLEDEVEKLKESYELQQQQKKRKKLKH